MSTLHQVQSALAKLEEADKWARIEERSFGFIASRYSPRQFKFFEAEQKYSFAVQSYNEALAAYENMLNSLPDTYRNKILSCNQDFGTLKRTIRALIAEQNGQDSTEAELDYLIGRVRARRNHTPSLTGRETPRVDLRGPNAGQKVHVTQVYADDWRISWDAYPDGTVENAHWSFQGKPEDHPTNFFGVRLGKPQDALFGEPHKR